MRELEIIADGGIIEGHPFTYVTDTGLPGYLSFLDNHETILFRPEALSELLGYNASCGLRYMDLMDAITDNFTVSWSQRSRTTLSQWRAIPAEVLISLSNTMGMNPWFNMNMAVDDDYVTQFWTLVQATLDPDLIPSCEYTNEAWGGSVAPANWCVARGAEQVPPIDYHHYYSRRAVQIFALAKAACPRVIRVMGSQAASVGVTNSVLGFENAYLHTDELAVAPYVGYETVAYHTMAEHLTWSQDNLFDNLEAQDVPAKRTEMAAQKAAVDVFNGLGGNIDLVCYEGGQTLITIDAGIYSDPSNERFNPTVLALYMAAQTNPRMYDVYATHLNDMDEVGVTKFYHYLHCGQWAQQGYWGAERYIGDVGNRPKLDALMAWTAAHPDETSADSEDASLPCEDRFPSFYDQGYAP